MLRKIVLSTLLLFGLGCSGLTEQLLELTTGGEVQITEDGMVMRMEDGSRVKVMSRNPTRPEAFPLPPPSPTAELVASTRMTSPTGHETVMLSYKLDQPKDTVLATYRAWFAERGIEPTFTEEQVVGTYSATLRGTLSEDMQAGVVISQAFGNDTINLMAGADLDALQNKR